jgi:hypothetical protein
VFGLKHREHLRRIVVVHLMPVYSIDADPGTAGMFTASGTDTPVSREKGQDMRDDS